jgi:hypothetical protein
VHHPFLLATQPFVWLPYASLPSASLPSASLGTGGTGRTGDGRTRSPRQSRFLRIALPGFLVRRIEDELVRTEF